MKVVIIYKKYDKAEVKACIHIMKEAISNLP